MMKPPADETPGSGRKGTPPRAIGSSGLFPAMAAATVLLAGLFHPPAVQGQTSLVQRLSLEPRFGAAFPTGDFGNVDPACPAGSVGCDYPTQVGTEVGWRFGLAGHYALTERWSLVATLGLTRLGCSASFCDVDEEPGTRSLALGARANALPLGSMDLWIEGGGVLEKATIVRTLDLVGEPISREVTYPWSGGVYVGAGANLPLRAAEDLFFTPGFRFHFASADPPDSDSDLRSINVTYAVAEIGVKILFGR